MIEILPIEELRLYCAIRDDLTIPDGKWMVQAGHAFVSTVEEARKLGRQDQITRYMEHGQPKIVVKAKNEAALRRAEAECKAAGIPCYLVTDAARTVFTKPTVTCLGIGPVLRSDLPKFVYRFQQLVMFDSEIDDLIAALREVEPILREAIEQEFPDYIRQERERREAILAKVRSILETF
jgi:PTH2 family peptidyl-tRNA hydrolase